MPENCPTFKAIPERIIVVNAHKYTFKPAYPFVPDGSIKILMNKKSSVRNKKSTFRIDVFENPDHSAFLLVNNILALTTLVSVGAVTLETVAIFQPYQIFFTIIEYIAVTIFTLEYLARIRIAKQPIKYIFSFFGLVDLIAIVPSLLGLSNLTFLKSARIVRIIRLLRVLRLAKFAQIKRRKNAAQSLYTINLEIYFLALTSAVLILGSLFYIFEQHSGAPDIPTGMYWTLRAILGGITYPQPETIGGTITLIMARFTSMILLGMMLGLVGTMLRKLLIGSEKDS